ncbi:hypothetical protein D918_02488, partial [Trichuris suis]
LRICKFRAFYVGYFDIVAEVLLQNAANANGLIISDQGNSPGCSGTGNSVVNGYPISTLGGFIGATGFGQQLFPLFPIAAQQMLVNQLLTNAGQTSLSASPSMPSSSVTRSSVDAEARKFDLCTFDRGRFAEANPKEELPFLKNRVPWTGNSQEASRRSYSNSEWSANVGNDCSLEHLLVGISGMVELAIASAKRQDEQARKEKEEALKALREEKERRARLELVVKEKERLQSWVLVVTEWVSFICTMERFSGVDNKHAYSSMERFSGVDNKHAYSHTT